MDETTANDAREAVMFSLVINAMEASGAKPNDVLLSMMTAFMIYAEKHVTKEQATAVIEAGMSTWKEELHE